MRRADLEELGRRMGLEGEELVAWCEERERRIREEMAEEMEFEREMRKKERELEELRQRTQQLRLKLAEVEARRREGREWRDQFSYLSSKEQLLNVCSEGRAFTSESVSLFSGSIANASNHTLGTGSQQIEDRGEAEREGETKQGLETVLSMASQNLAKKEQSCSFESNAAMRTGATECTLIGEVHSPLDSPDRVINVRMKCAIEDREAVSREDAESSRIMSSTKTYARVMHEIQVENSTVVAAESFCVSPAAVIKDTGMTDDHANNSIFNTEKLALSVGTDEMYPSELANSAEAHFNEPRLGSQVQSAVGDNEERQAAQDGRAGTLGVQTDELVKSEPELNNFSPSYCYWGHEDADVCSIAFSSAKATSLKVSGRSEAYGPKQGIRLQAAFVRMLLSRRTHWHWVGFGCNPSYAEANVLAEQAVAEHTSLFTLTYGRAFCRQSFRDLPTVFAGHAKRVVRLVWDAIT